MREHGTDTRVGTGSAPTQAYTLYKSLLVDWENAALDWNMKYYRLQQFRDFYGAEAGVRKWETASRATMDAIATANTLLECTDRITTLARECLTDMIHISDDDDVHKEILTAFYVPLRWRYMYLQSININENEWSTFDLSAKSQQEKSWDFVRTFVRKKVLTPTQRQTNKRNTLELMTRKMCKSTHLCKVLLNYGAPIGAKLLSMLITLHTHINEKDKHDNIAQNISTMISQITDTNFL